MNQPINEEDNLNAAHEWPAVPFGELAVLRLGRTPARAEARFWSNGVVPWVSIADLNFGTVAATKERISQAAFDEVFRGTAVPAGTLLMSFKLSIGKVGILAMPAVHNEAIVSISPDSSKATRDYLFYALQQFDFTDSEDAYVKGKTLNKDKLQRLAIPLPPIQEQQALGAALRTAQGAKEACDRVLAATYQLKASLLRHLFTYGSVGFHETDNVALQETDIGPLPAHWQVVRVAALGEVVTGRTPSTQQPHYYGGPHMFITPGDMGSWKYITKTARRLSTDGLHVCRSLPKNAVVVVCIGATIGKTGLTGEDNCATNQQCNAVIPNATTDPDFLFYALSNRASALAELAGRAAVPIVNKSNFCDFPIAVPPLAEQREIATMLSAVDATLLAEETRHAALTSLFSSLLDHLMTGKVRLPEFANV